MEAAAGGRGLSPPEVSTAGQGRDGDEDKAPMAAGEPPGHQHREQAGEAPSTSEEAVSCFVFNSK